MLLKRSDFFDYQEKAHAFFMERGRCAWWIDMGLGKTAPALTCVADLFDEFAISKVLVVAPKKVAESTWPDEVKQWEHLQHLKVSVCTGGEKGVLAGLARDAHIYTVNVEMLHFLVEHFKKKWPFDFVILDEASQYKTPSSQRFRALRKLVKRDLIEWLLELTGTPAPNGLLDVWGPMFLIDKGEALGSTYGDYQKTYFTRDFMGYSYEINPGAEERIYERIGDKALVIRGSNTEATRLNEYRITLSKKALEQYEELERDMVLQLADGDAVEAVNNAVLQNKLQQLASGNIYITDELTGVRETKHLHDEKLKSLGAIVDEANGNPILVGYVYKHERDAIMRKFPKAVALDAKADTAKIIRDWNAGKIPMLIGHPASMGHGLNLQHGGHIAVWYSVPWSLELYQQFNKRLDRTGQKQRVVIHHLICEGTVDETILTVVNKKDATQAALTKAVERRVNEILKQERPRP